MGEAIVTEERREVFESLYAQHRLDVLAYCTRRAGMSDAADVCSETFLVAWRRIDDIPAPPQSLPYLYGIASRVLSNHFRTMQRRSRLNSMLGVLGVTPTPDPSVLVVQSSQNAEVASAIRRLKPKDREIVMLYTWEDLSRETIADMMGTTKAAIDQRIHRSYRRMARTLAPMLERNPTTSPPIANEGGT
jgi:RNA polymerase sigma-70 factor (ECF subfamily)